MATNETGPFKVGADKKPLRIGGEKVIDPLNPALSVDGLTPSTQIVEPATSFGASGDVFDHGPWRVVFSMLWAMPESKKYMLGLSTALCMRGKTLKVNNRGKCINYSVPLGPLSQRNEQQKQVLGEGTHYSLKINYPTEQSRVLANALTPERAKCCFRLLIIGDMMSEKRLPAIAESMGYGDLFRSLVSFELVRNMEKDKMDEDYKPDYELWSPIVTALKAESQLKVSARACASASMSTKEVYAVDEEIIPGTLWWSAIHSFMNDCVCRVKAPSAAKDKISRLENSSFYGDFKKKAGNRGLNVSEGGEFWTFMNNMVSVMIKFAKVGAGLTEQENRLLESLVTGVRQKRGDETRTLLGEKGSTTFSDTFGAIKGTDAESVKAYIDAAVAKMSNMSAEEDGDSA